MKRYQFDNSYRLWYLRAPTMMAAIAIAIPKGCHAEEDFPYEDNAEESPFSAASRFFFVVNDASGAVVDYLRVVEAPGTNEWYYVDTEDT